MKKKHKNESHSEKLDLSQETQSQENHTQPKQQQGKQTQRQKTQAKQKRQNKQAQRQKRQAQLKQQDKQVQGCDNQDIQKEYEKETGGGEKKREISKTKDSNRIYNKHLRYSYYLVIIIILLISFFVFKKCQLFIAGFEVFPMHGYKIVQNNKAIEEIVIPYIYAISTAISTLFAMIMVFVVSWCYSTKGLFAPFIDVIIKLLAIIIAIGAVYTVGYDSSSEILRVYPDYFSDVKDKISGNSDQSENTYKLETYIQENDADETHSNSNSDDIREEDHISYVTDVNGNSKKTPLLARQFNETINLTFMTAAALIIPLEYYKKKRDSISKG